VTLIVVRIELFGKNVSRVTIVSQRESSIWLESVITGLFVTGWQLQAVKCFQFVWQTMHGVAVGFYYEQNIHSCQIHYFIQRFGLLVSHHQE